MHPKNPVENTKSDEPVGHNSDTAQMVDPRVYLTRRAEALRRLAGDIETLCGALPETLSERQMMALGRLSGTMMFQA